MLEPTHSSSYLPLVRPFHPSYLHLPYFSCSFQPWSPPLHPISLLFLGLLVLCSSVVPQICQFLCNITSWKARVFSFDFGELLRTRRTPKEAAWVHWSPWTSFWSPLQGDVGFHFFFMTSFANLCHVFKFPLFLSRHGLPLFWALFWELWLVDRSITALLLVFPQQVYTMNAYGDILPPSFLGSPLPCRCLVAFLPQGRDSPTVGLALAWAGAVSMELNVLQWLSPYIFIF